MLLFVGVLFAATAASSIAPPTAKDVGFEYSINLDTQNFDFVSIPSAEVYVYSCESSTIQFITLKEDVGVKSEMQVEGLLNLKILSLNSESNCNLTPASIEKRSVYGVNYYYRC